VTLVATLKLYSPALVLALWALALLILGQYDNEPASATAGWLILLAVASVVAEHERARRRRESRRP
jgi:hypothetical protein